MSRAKDSELARGGAPLALGLMVGALIAEARFRVLQSQTLALLQAEPAAEGGEAVAAWLVAGSMLEPWISALVLGGVSAGTAVAVCGLASGRRLLLALLFGGLTTLVLAGLGVVGTHYRVPDWPALARAGLHPATLAGLCCTGMFLVFWVLAPLAVRAGRSRAVWFVAALAIALAGVHGATLVRRGEAPRHPVRETARWFVTDGDAPRVDGDVTLDNFGAMRVGVGAQWMVPLANGARFSAFMESGGVARQVHALPGAAEANAPYRLIGARFVTDSDAVSTRSNADAPSLITLAVDGLRGTDLESLLRAGTAPPAVQQLAEAGVLFPGVIAPDSDPRSGEVALLAGVHPASIGRAPVPQHLGALLGSAGFVSHSICEGAPRAGVVGGFATVDTHAGAATIARARNFLALHGEERFHLHVSIERLSLEALWTDETQAPGSPRPPQTPSLAELRGTALQRGLEHATRAARQGDEPPIDVSLRAWLDAAHRARTRELLVELGRLFADLEALGLTRRTVVVLAGTSGIALGERGMLGFGQDLHAVSVRVPLLARGPGLPEGEIRPGERTLVSVAPALATLLGVPWPGTESSWSWVPAEPLPTPIFTRTERGIWNGVADRELLALRDDEFVLFWCPAAEGDVALLPDSGPWRLHRLEGDEAERVDLSLVPRFRQGLFERRATLRIMAEAHFEQRSAAERILEPWRTSAAWTDEERSW